MSVHTDDWAEGQVEAPKVLSPEESAKVTANRLNEETKADTEIQKLRTANSDQELGIAIAEAVLGLSPRWRRKELCIIIEQLIGFGQSVKLANQFGKDVGMSYDPLIYSALNG